MRKLQITLLIVLSSIFFTNGAIAQNKPLACQVEAAAGLLWENGRWVTKSFVRSKFILVQTGNTLTLASVGKVLAAPPEMVTCRNTKHEIECTSEVGGGLYFDSRTLNGGISMLFGSTNSSDERDTVTAKVFSCTAF